MDMTARRWSYTSAYIGGLFGEQDGLLRWARELAAERGLPDIAVPPETGRVLKLLAELAGAPAVASGRRPLAIEVGTCGGYSTLWIAAGLSAVSGGRVVTIERDAQRAAVAREVFGRAGLGSSVELREGDALEVLAALGRELGPGSVDFAFIDAEKTQYPAYLALIKPLMVVGGVIAADNALGSSEWWIDDPSSTNAARDAVDRLNRDLASDPAYESVCIPLRHGVVVGRRKR